MVRSGVESGVRLRTVQTKEVGGHQQLEADLGWYVHVGYINALAVPPRVVEVLDHLLEDHSTADGKKTEIS